MQKEGSSHSRMSQLHGSLNLRIVAFPTFAVLGFCHFRNHCEIHTISRRKATKAPFNPFRFTWSERRNDKSPTQRWSVGRWSVDRLLVACFHAFLAADSSTWIPRTHFGWIRIGKLEATTTRRCRRGSPVCKKELSSNRINDPLTSIYRARKRRCGGGTHRRDARKDELVELSSKDDEAAAVSPRRPFAAQTSCAENIVCFLAVLGSLCRRCKFNRARALFSASKFCFRLHPSAQMWDMDDMSGNYQKMKIFCKYLLV